MVLVAWFWCSSAMVELGSPDLIGGRTLAAERGRGSFVAGLARRKADAKTALAAPVISPPCLPQRIVHGALEFLGGDRDVRLFTDEDLKHPQSWESCKVQRGGVFVQPGAAQSPPLCEARALGIPRLVPYRDPPKSPFFSTWMPAFEAPERLAEIAPVGAIAVDPEKALVLTFERDLP